MTLSDLVLARLSDLCFHPQRSLTSRQSIQKWSNAHTGTIYSMTDPALVFLPDRQPRRRPSRLVQTQSDSRFSLSGFVERTLTKLAARRQDAHTARDLPWRIFEVHDDPCGLHRALKPGTLFQPVCYCALQRHPGWSPDLCIVPTKSFPCSIFRS
jgi:hypothetical protein